MPTELGPGSGTGPLLKNIYLAPGHYWYYGPPKAQYLINKLLYINASADRALLLLYSFFSTLLLLPNEKREDNEEISVLDVRGKLQRVGPNSPRQYLKVFCVVPETTSYNGNFQRHYCPSNPEELGFSSLAQEITLSHLLQPYSN